MYEMHSIHASIPDDQYNFGHEIARQTVTLCVCPMESNIHL